MHQTAFRVTGSFLGYFLSNVLLFCLLFAFYTATNFWEHSPTVEEFIISISVSVFFTIFLGGIYELKYYLRKWSDSIKESESLKSEKLQAQLNALRSQVNPHFLFNSLNTLESLAEEVRAPRVAKYVNELANVYRYSLKNQENDLIELEDELKFIEGYYYLLTTRYDNHLVLTIHVDEAQRKYLLPPLTLQILVENAVKHNVISAKCPLCITISSNGGDTITVLNALQPKKQAVLSHGMGLENIGSRYKLLGIEGPKVLKSAGEYNVVIKLINNASVRF
jgi:sensor histidine kinase YesM